MCLHLRDNPEFMFNHAMLNKKYIYKDTKNKSHMTGVSRNVVIMFTIQFR